MTRRPNPEATVDQASYRDPVTASLARGARVVPGTTITSYYRTGGRELVGDGGHLTYATLRLPISPEKAKDKVQPIREALGTPAGFERTLVGGQAALDHDTRTSWTTTSRRPRPSPSRSRS